MEARADAAPGSSGKSIGITLTDADMYDFPNWENMSPLERWRALTKRADSFVVEHMIRNGDVTPEWGANRIQEIQNG